MDEMRHGNQTQAAQEELKQLMSIIAGASVKLYDLMKAGATIEVQIPESNPILVPNQPPKVRRLFITKPAIFAQVSVTTR